MIWSGLRRLYGSLCRVKVFDLASLDGVHHWIFYILFATAVPFIFEVTKRNKYDRWIGELSYPLYLVHGLVQGIFFFYLGARGGHVPTMLAALSCSIAAAIAMRLIVQRPIELAPAQPATRCVGHVGDRLCPRRPQFHLHETRSDLALRHVGRLGQGQFNDL